MKKFVNGTFVELTPEEIAALEAVSVSTEPTIEERLDALESAMLEQLLGSEVLFNV